jgi:hypothetical protein
VACDRVVCGGTDWNRASLADVVVQRTRMYKDHLRWWYEAYFLGRRAVFVAVSVALARLPVIRSVRSSPPSSYALNVDTEFP